LPVILGGLLLPAAAAQTPVAETPTESAIRQGAAAMRAGAFSQAVEAYRQAVTLQPSFAEAYFNLGLALQQAGQLDQARSALEQALKLKPALRGAHLFLGTIAYQQSRFSDAEEQFLRETRIDPNCAKAFMWLGVARLAEEKPEQAIAPLETAHRLDPNDIDTLYHRGRAYFLLADANYTAMFKLDPDSVRVHQVLAEANATGFRTAEAITQYEIAVKLAPKLVGLHESLGDQYWILGSLDKAEAAYRAELDLAGTNPVARYKLGSLLVVHGNPGEGVALLEQVLTEQPNLTDAHYYLGEGLRQLERYEEAAEQYRLAIAADAASDRAISSYYKLAQIERKMGHAAEAQQALARYQVLKAQRQSRLDTRNEQIERKRSALPVEAWENSSEATGK
jgi:superkiller protein 3